MTRTCTEPQHNGATCDEVLADIEDGDDGYTKECNVDMDDGRDAFWLSTSQECVNCPIGMWVNETEDGCESCPPGSIYNPEEKRGEDACQECSGGLWPVENSCQPCPTGYVCKNGEKTKCSHNEYVNENKCTICSTCNEGEKTETECSGNTNRICGCNIGYYGESPNCIVCPSGTYGIEMVESRISMETACAICPSGNYCNDGKKYKCDPGYYSEDGAKNIDQCEMCPSGNYTNTDENICISCGLHYSSVPGSIGIESCQLKPGIKECNLGGGKTVAISGPDWKQNTENGKCFKTLPVGTTLDWRGAVEKCQAEILSDEARAKGATVNMTIIENQQDEDEMKQALSDISGEVDLWVGAYLPGDGENTNQWMLGHRDIKGKKWSEVPSSLKNLRNTKTAVDCAYLRVQNGNWSWHKDEGCGVQTPRNVVCSIFDGVYGVEEKKQDEELFSYQAVLDVFGCKRDEVYLQDLKEKIAKQLELPASMIIFDRVKCF